MDGRNGWKEQMEGMDVIGGRDGLKGGMDTGGLEEGRMKRKKKKLNQEG